MKQKLLFGAIILALLIFILVQKGCYQKRISKLASTNELLQMDKQQMQKEVNKRGYTINQQKSAIIESKKVLSKYADSVFAIKRAMGATIAYYKNNVRTRIDSFETAYAVTVHDTLPVYIEDAFAREHMVQVPKEFSADSPYYSIRGTVKKSGVTINQINVTDTLTGRFVEGRRRLFRQPDIYHQVMNSNPNISITGMQSVVYRPSKKTVFGKVLKAAALVGVGIITGMAIK